MPLVPPSFPTPDNPLAIVSYIAVSVSVLICLIVGASLIATVFWKRIFTEIDPEELDELWDS